MTAPVIGITTYGPDAELRLPSFTLPIAYTAAVEQAGGVALLLPRITPERDHYELELARRALERPELPVLGICRGMQLLNVALGGDLTPHLPDLVGDEVAHRVPPLDPTLHEVRVEAGSVLDEIYRRPEFQVCLWHHQGVRELGAGLVPVAWAPDGVIEGLVLEDHRCALGVQWQPVMQAADDPLQRRLFSALIEQARRGAGR